SFAFGETEWDDGRAKTGEGPAQQEDHDRAGKAADGFVLTKMAVKSEKDLSEQLRGHWLKAVAAIELRNFGYAISLLQGILKQAPVAAGWPQIGVFALQTLLEDKPRDTKILHELSRLYHDLGESDKEVEIYNRITEIDPVDAEALRLGKDASARASIKTGGWTQAESYRDLIKDKAAAVSLEQQGRMALTGESLEQQIEETYARHQAEPESIDSARRLGDLHEQKEDFENAIAWYQYAADLTSGNDPGMVRKVSDLQGKRAEHEIAAHTEFLATHGPEDEDYNERAEALAAAKKR